MNRDHLVALAAEIAKTKDTLSRLESEFDRLLGTQDAQTQSWEDVTVAVSSRVRSALVSGPMTFGELLTRVQPATRSSVKSVLHKDRLRGRVECVGGKWKLK